MRRPHPRRRPALRNGAVARADDIHPCPVLAVYGHHDPALIDALPDVRADMETAGVDFEAIIYPDASHAFFNDSGPRYDADAAADAWDRVRGFLGQVP